MYRRRYDSPAHQSLNCIKNKNKINYGEKRFSICRMEFLHPAMWHDHNIDFVRWLHPVVWHAALESWQWIHQVAAPCMWHVGWHTIEFAQTSAILEFYIWFPFPHITAVNMSFCTGLQNFIQMDHTWQKKMTSCRFSRWRISAILDCRDPIIVFLKSPVKPT